MRVNKFNNLIYRKLWFVLLVPIILSGLVTMIFMLVNPMEYESGTSLYLSNKNFQSNTELTYSDMLAGRSLVDNYEQIIKSDMFSERVIMKLELLNITPQFLANRIDTKPIKNSNILLIKVRQKDKLLARSIADATPIILSEIQAEISSPIHITVLNKSSKAVPVFSGITILACVSYFVGLLLVIAVLVLFQPNRNIIRTPADVEKHLGLIVAGTIPDFTF